MRIHVTTRADLFERRKQEHIDRGYRIEYERPIPLNGFCPLSQCGSYPPPTDLASWSPRLSTGAMAATEIGEAVHVAQNPMSFRREVQPPSSLQPETRRTASGRQM